MSRPYHSGSIELLHSLAQAGPTGILQLQENFSRPINNKDFYNLIYRLSKDNLISKSAVAGETILTITQNGQKLLKRLRPEKDGVWKLVIFDIPENQKYVRTVLRAKLKALHFKKWQNSIWISPYKLDDEIEKELKQLAKKFFVRLIKTVDINYTGDLEKMFKIN